MCRKPHNMSEISIADRWRYRRSRNLSTSLSNVAKLATHPKFVWVFNDNCDGTIIYNDPVLYPNMLFQLLFPQLPVQINEAPPTFSLNILRIFKHFQNPLCLQVVRRSFRAYCLRSSVILCLYK
jgi:hypothetical protein